MTDDLHRKLMPYILTIVKDRAAAEDIIQDSILKFLTAKGYTEKGKGNRYITRIARNTALDFLRKKKAVSLTGDLPDPADPSSAEKKELIELIGEAEKSLPPKLRETFRLHYHEGFTYKEISQLTAENINTLLSYDNKAIKKIRQMLQDHEQ